MDSKTEPAVYCIPNLRAQGNEGGGRGKTESSMDAVWECMRRIDCNGQHSAGLPGISGRHRRRQAVEALSQGSDLGEYVWLEKRVNALLKNTLPAAVAGEIQVEGRFSPRIYFCTILFSDFVSFIQLAENLSMEKLIETLHLVF